MENICEETTKLAQSQRYVCPKRRIFRCKHRPSSRLCRYIQLTVLVLVFMCATLHDHLTLLIMQQRDTYCKGPELSVILNKDQNHTQTTSINLTEAFYNRQRTKICPFRFNTLIRPKQDCADDTFMVILTHSYHKYIDKRNAIRQTWGGAATGKLPWPGQDIPKKIKMMFVFGQNRDPVLNARIKNESAIFDDILVGNFSDDYVNMTYKSLFGLKYVSEHCRSAKYLLKTDDDMIVNMPLLIDMLEKTPLTRSILGNQLHGKVNRWGKWALTRQQFPFDHFPTYEAGGAYVITSDIVRELFDTAEYVPQFSVDDVYVAGVLAKIIGANHVHHPELFWGDRTWGDKRIKPCEIVTNRRLMQTKMNPSKLLDIWTKLKTVSCNAYK